MIWASYLSSDTQSISTEPKTLFAQFSQAAIFERSIYNPTVELVDRTRFGIKIPHKVKKETVIEADKVRSQDVKSLVKLEAFKTHFERVTKSIIGGKCKSILGENQVGTL